MTGSLPDVRFGTVVLFGGTGFIGTHFASFLLQRQLARNVVLADIRAGSDSAGNGASRYIETDVRTPIENDLLDESPDLIVNLAAIHREPGHQPHEYFETNVRGAENVCAYAARVGCRTMIFTSSISVYGPTEEERDESSLAVPISPYGASKLVAERVHLAWQQSAPDRRLLVVRPGVVFGPGESGNVTRLVRAVTRGYFVFCGNQHVRKAGGYVKELCNAMHWGVRVLEHRNEAAFTFNFTQDPTPRLDELVSAIAATAGRRAPKLSVPFLPILAASHALETISKLVRVKQPLHPVRAHKLVRSNNISAGILRRYGYTALFTTRAAFDDWKRSHPSDWQ